MRILDIYKISKHGKIEEYIESIEGFDQKAFGNSIRRELFSNPEFIDFFKVMYRSSGLLVNLRLFDDDFVDLVQIAQDIFSTDYHEYYLKFSKKERKNINKWLRIGIPELGIAKTILRSFSVTKVEVPDPQKIAGMLYHTTRALEIKKNGLNYVAFIPRGAEEFMLEIYQRPSNIIADLYFIVLFSFHFGNNTVINILSEAHSSNIKSFCTTDLLKVLEAKQVEEIKDLPIDWLLEFQ